MFALGILLFEYCSVSWTASGSNAQQWSSEICGDLGQTPVRQQRGLEEAPGCADVSRLGHMRIDELAVLIHGRLHVPPHAATLT